MLSSAQLSRIRDRLFFLCLFPFLVKVSVFAHKSLIFIGISTDTPVAGCRWVGYWGARQK